MLELDLLLLEFLEIRYANLDKDLQQAFVALLDYPDPSLQRWLIGDGEGVADGMQAIVKTIREGSGDGEESS